MCKLLANFDEDNKLNKLITLFKEPLFKQPFYLSRFVN